LGRIDKGAELDVARLIVGWADLREHVGAAALPRPFVDRPHQAIERKLHPDRDEDHMTVPAKCGPFGRARCGHCVSHRSAQRPAKRPDMESSSTLAMLSTQIVFAPIRWPISSAT